MKGTKKRELKDIAKDTIKDMKEKVWPITLRELENALKNSKEMIDKGEHYLKIASDKSEKYLKLASDKSEKYIKDVSEKGVQQTKRLTLSLQREKHYYDAGKLVARIPRSKLTTHPKLAEAIKSIQDLTKAIKAIK